MKRYRLEIIVSIVAALAITMLIGVNGCGLFYQRPDPEQLMYVSAKVGIYGLWRLETVTVEELRTARPHIEALEAALSAETEKALDEALSAYLATWAETIEHAGDRALVLEIVNQALQDVRLTDPTIETNREKKALLAVVRGILAGIKLVEAQ